MLQWMGGSRRKVTASRKSTQKRQKQYFEQRKRQQQQQIATSERYADGNNICGQHQKEHRSLDILSFLNLSATIEDCEHTCPTGKEGPDSYTSTVKYHVTKDPPASSNSTLTYADSVKVEGERSSSGYEMENASTKKVLFRAADSHEKTSNAVNSNPDPVRRDSGKQFSVFDLLLDDGPNGELEGSQIQEAHVAFSVEGLGKVETETPPESPRQPDGIFFCHRSLPLNVAKQLNSSENFNLLDNLELEVDAVMRDVDLPLSGSSSHFAEVMTHTYSKRQHKLSISNNDNMQLDIHSSKRKSFFNDVKNLYDIENDIEDIWEARSSFLNRNSLNQRENHTFWKNWQCQRDCYSADFFEYGNDEISDYAFGASHVMRKRDAAKPTKAFPILESAASKASILENDCDFLTSRQHILGSNCDSKDQRGQVDWPPLVTEDARDTLSLLSEESCSSSSVRGEIANTSLLNSTARQSRRHASAFGSPVIKDGVEDIFLLDADSKIRDDFRQAFNAQGPQNCRKMPVSSKSKQRQHAKSPFPKELGSPEHWLFQEGHTLPDISSAFNSICQTTKTKIPSSETKLWTEHSFEVGSRPSNQDTSIDFEVEAIPPDMFRVAGLREETLSAQESLTKDNHAMPPDLLCDAGLHGDTLSAQESLTKDNYEKVEHRKQTFTGETDLFPLDKMAMDASSSEGNTFESNEAEDRTLELKKSLRTLSSNHLDETSSSVKTPDKVKNEEYNHVAESPSCQNGSEDLFRRTENSRPEDRKAVSKGESNSIDASQKVMMLESHVLQLLCIQKVLKNGTELKSVKKLFEATGFEQTEFEKPVRSNNHKLRSLPQITLVTI